MGQFYLLVFHLLSFFFFLMSSLTCQLQDGTVCVRDKNLKPEVPVWVSSMCFQGWLIMNGGRRCICPNIVKGCLFLGTSTLHEQGFIYPDCLRGPQENSSVIFRSRSENPKTQEPSQLPNHLDISKIPCMEKKGRWECNGAKTQATPGASSSGILIIFLDSLGEAMQELKEDGMALSLTQSRSRWDREEDSRKGTEHFWLWWRALAAYLVSTFALLHVTRHEPRDQLATCGPISL